jgi:hypothetical protein
MLLQGLSPARAGTKKQTSRFGWSVLIQAWVYYPVRGQIASSSVMRSK